MTEEKRQVLDHEVALKVYLDALLTNTMTVPMEEETDVAVEEAEPPAVVEVTEPEVSKHEQVEEACPAESTQYDVTERLKALQQQAEQALSGVQTETEVGSGGGDQVVQDPLAWTHEDFQSLIFHVAGLQLAVPLVKLNGVLEWPETITPMPGHQPWFLGVMSYHGKQVKIVDTAHIVLPEQSQALALTPEQRNFNRIVLVGDGCWGLACEGVGEVFNLTHNEVRWRSERTVRRWLIGTVVERMCALLDVDEIAKILEEG